MSSRYSKDEKEHRTNKEGRDRSRSRSPKRRDNDNSKRREKEHERREEYKKDNYKWKEDYKRTEENYRKYDGAYKKQDYDLKQQEDDYRKPENHYSKLLEQSTAAPNEEKKTSISLAPKSKLKSMSIQMKIGGSSTKPKLNVAAAFSQDSDDEPDQMPPEARMRMKNIGRNTPTSSGPNSFGKTKQGFSDAKKVFERNLKEAMDAARADD